MRQIILDTETTGLDPRPDKGGHRVVEIACLEMKNRHLTGRQLHYYLNPERDIDAEAEQKHGLSREFLADKPRFAENAPELLEFLERSELIIHNAPFDLGFLNAEFARLDGPKIENHCSKVTDTLKMARERFPGKANSLDALCDRFDIDRAMRDVHGALIDTHLLAKVYQALTRGQDSLIEEDGADTRLASNLPAGSLSKRPKVLPASEAEIAAHAKMLEHIERNTWNDEQQRGNCLWLHLDDADARNDQND